MALGSLGVNKLRSFLTMSGITIGVFSVIGVMTAVSALRGSIETGLSFLGSNMFQFSKFPVNGGGEGPQRRFATVVHLLSVRHNRRLRLRCFAADNALPVVPSLVPVYPVANWFEREAFDLFGIVYEGHPDLRRILTDYGFVGHPFRKDFPLIGNGEVRYDEAKGRVVYEPVQITQRTLVPRVIREDNRYDDALKDGRPNG